jgi:predicted transcriptional regulator
MSEDSKKEHLDSIFTLRRLPEYSDDAIPAELRRVAALATDQPMTTALFQKYSSVSGKIYNARFGTWKDALTAAGLADRWSGATATLGTHQSIKMSDLEVLEALKNLARRLGKSELKSSDLKNNVPFGSETLRARWDTFRAALEAAGLSSSNMGRRYTDKECLENLFTVWTHYGRPPNIGKWGFRHPWLVEKRMYYAIKPGIGRLLRL